MEADGGVSLEHLSVLSLYFIALYLALPPVCTDPKAIVIDVLSFFSYFNLFISASKQFLNFSCVHCTKKCIEFLTIKNVFSLSDLVGYHTQNRL